MLCACLRLHPLLQVFIDQPSVDLTISILRGLRPRYEVGRTRWGADGLPSKERRRNDDMHAWRAAGWRRR